MASAAASRKYDFVGVCVDSIRIFKALDLFVRSQNPQFGKEAWNLYPFQHIIAVVYRIGKFAFWGPVQSQLSSSGLETHICLKMVCEIELTVGTLRSQQNIDSWMPHIDSRAPRYRDPP